MLSIDSQILFLLFGGCTVVWGLIMLLLLPNPPATCRFLNPREQKTAVRRVQTSASLTATDYKLYQVREAFRDPQTYLLVIYTFCMNIPNGGLTSFGSLVISGFGYSTYETLILQIPVACAQFFLDIARSQLGDVHQERNIGKNDFDGCDKVNGHKIKTVKATTDVNIQSNWHCNDVRHKFLI